MVESVFKLVLQCVVKGQFRMVNSQIHVNWWSRCLLQTQLLLLSILEWHVGAGEHLWHNGLNYIHHKSIHVQTSCFTGSVQARTTTHETFMSALKHQDATPLVSKVAVKRRDAGMQGVYQCVTSCFTLFSAWSLHPFLSQDILVICLCKAFWHWLFL